VPRLLATGTLGTGSAPQWGIAGSSLELDEPSQAGSPVTFWPSAGPPFPSCPAGSSSISTQRGRARRRIEGAVIPHFVINDLVTPVGENLLRVHGRAVCSKVLDLLKIRSPWVGLATNLELRSADDAARATALTTREGRVVVLSTLEMAASAMLPRRLAEASEPANALLHDSVFPVSPNQWNSQAPRSCARKNAQGGAEGGRLRDDANRQQFQLALLENCSFFADLVLRQVRAGGDPCSDLLERDSSRKKWNVVRVSPTPPRSRAKVVLGQRLEEPGLPPETPSSVLQTLWVEVGCRQVQTLVSEKERHQYGEDSKPAL
jgi:hypothetical protein